MAMRREPGEGQVNWIGRNNTYQAVLLTGTNQVTGKPTMKTRYADVKGKTRAGYRDGERCLQELKDELAAEQAVQAQALDPATYTVWDCILDWHGWVPSTGKTSQQTADKLRRTCEIWVHGEAVPQDPRPAELCARLREFGDLPLISLTAVKFGAFLALVAPHTGKPTLKDLLHTIRRSIRHHMNTESPVVDRNVTISVDVPMAGKPHGKPTFLTREQAELCFSGTEGSRMHALMLVGILLGLRPGEIATLKWTSIDFGKGRHGWLYVESWRRKDGDGRTKTDLSNRGLPLNQRLRDALLAHQQQWGDSTYVFVREDGRQLDKDAMAWRVGQVFRAAGLPAYDVYTMRHTFASLMNDQGVPWRRIADAMGHASLDTFDRVYRHHIRPEVTRDDDLWDGTWDAA